MNDWITEGGKVAVITSGTYGDSVQIATVERFTSTQIVTEYGWRFYRDGLREVGRNSRRRLVDPNDPHVLRLRASALVEDLSHQVYRLTHNRTEVRTAPHIVLAEVEAAVAAVRAKMPKLDA